LRRKESNSSFIVLLVLSLIAGGAYYLYDSPMFEREAPSITLDTNGYWNLKKPLKLNISDPSGIKAYKVVLKSDTLEKTLFSEVPMTLSSSIDISVEHPRGSFSMKDKNVKILVLAQDASKWNFLNGNKVIKEFELKIDKRRPDLVTIALLLSLR